MFNFFATWTMVFCLQAKTNIPTEDIRVKRTYRQNVCAQSYFGIRSLTVVCVAPRLLQFLDTNFSSWSGSDRAVICTIAMF